MRKFRTPYLFRWIFHRRVWGFSLVSTKVYLTFDDGPTEECTRWILAQLKEHEALATFFCVGANAKALPELMKEMRSEGHAIGNHTMRHEKGTKVSKSDYLASIEDASKHIPSPLFRPPYGRVPMAYTSAIRKSYRIVMWSWLSYDYDKEVPVETILKSAKSIRGGDILVLHDNLKSFDRVQEILPALLCILNEKGLKCDVISA